MTLLVIMLLWFASGFVGLQLALRWGGLYDPRVDRAATILLSFIGPVAGVIAALTWWDYRRVRGTGR